MTFLATLKDVLETLSYITVIVGFPVAIYQYRRKTIKEQADREYGTYNALDEKYLEFQRLCFENPSLDIFDVRDREPRVPSEDERKQELIAFTMLFSVFERAYLMYHDQPDGIRQRQWSGWHEYIREYCGRANFQAAWEISGETFDTEYQVFMSAEITRAKGQTVPVHSLQVFGLE
jgi:hypothetical protein